MPTRPPAHSILPHASAATLLAFALALGGCAKETTAREDVSMTRPLPPEPRPAPTPPPGALANEMLFIVGGSPADLNGNGFPDTVRVSVHLFPSPHPSPIWEPGDFVFQIFPEGQSRAPGVEPIAEWVITAAEAETARLRTLVGPGYQFDLDLAAVGAERRPAGFGDLVARFEPADGREPVRSSGFHRIEIGAGRAGRP